MEASAAAAWSPWSDWGAAISESLHPLLSVYKPRQLLLYGGCFSRTHKRLGRFTKGGSPEYESLGCCLLTHGPPLGPAHPQGRAIASLWVAAAVSEARALLPSAAAALMEAVGASAAAVGKVQSQRRRSQKEAEPTEHSRSHRAQPVPPPRTTPHTTARVSHVGRSATPCEAR